jgi:hypothetical protein
VQLIQILFLFIHHFSNPDSDIFANRERGGEMSIENFPPWVNKKIHLLALRIYNAPWQGSLVGYYREDCL